VCTTSPLSLTALASPQIQVFTFREEMCATYQILPGYLLRERDMTEGRVKQQQQHGEPRSLY